MKTFMKGYKQDGLDFSKVIKKNNKFSCPKDIPFYGYNLNPDLSKVDESFEVYKDSLINKFEIILKGEHRGNIKVNNEIIDKNYFFCNFVYNFKEMWCYKKPEKYDAIKMEGIFFCLEENNKPRKGECGDYLIKKNNTFSIIKSEDIGSWKKCNKIINRAKLHKKYYQIVSMLKFNDIITFSFKEVSPITVCFPKIEYNDGVIKVSDGDNSIYLKKSIYPIVIINSKGMTSSVTNVNTTYKSVSFIDWVVSLFR